MSTCLYVTSTHDIESCLILKSDKILFPACLISKLRKMLPYIDIFKIRQAVSAKYLKSTLILKVLFPNNANICLIMLFISIVQWKLKWYCDVDGGSLEEK